MRIQKYLSQLGVAPRRQVEEAIRCGEIEIDGKTALLGDQITPGKQVLIWKGTRYTQLPSHQQLTLAMHKPRGVLCSHSDPHHPETLFQFLPERYQKKKWILAGRLDKESEGLLLLSEDGALVQQITHPSYRISKKYKVWFDSIVWTAKDSEALLEGIEDEGEFLQAFRVSPARRSGNGSVIEIVLKQGHKREIRRLMKSRRKRVTRLLRTQIGRVSLGRLGVGECRVLTPEEIASLKERTLTRSRFSS